MEIRFGPKMGKDRVMDPGTPKKLTTLTGTVNFRVWRKEQERLAHSKGYFYLLTQLPTPFPDTPPPDPLGKFLQGAIPPIVVVPALEDGQVQNPAEVALREAKD